MFLILMVTFLLFFILFILYIILMLFQKHKVYDREKNSPFECGFDSMSSSRVSFSIHFFSIMLMFLIFDIEITILVPLPMIVPLSKIQIWGFSGVILLITLMLGLLVEWKEGSMNWN